MKHKYLIAICIAVVAILAMTGCPAYEPQDEPPAPNPATSSTPVVPDTPTAPAISDIPAVPDTSTAPAVPDIPAVFDTPTAPAIPDIPAVPGTLVSDEVSVHVLNVGEGLSVFIDDGDTEVLIDGGYMKYGKDISKYIRDYVNGNIEYVIATHSDGDHVGGLIRIYADYQVSYTIYGDTSQKGNYPKFEAAAQNEPDSVYKNDEDEIIELSDGVTLSILDIIDDAGDTNDNSVISFLDVGGLKLLVTGDAQAYTENLLLGKIGQVDVYVVGHHGSETSSSQAFLDEIRPEYGIISSAGPEYRGYNNPDISVLDRLYALGTKMFATYRSGNITVTFDDGTISLSPPESQQITPQNYKEAA